MATDIFTYSMDDVKSLPYTIPVYVATGATEANLQLFADDLTDAIDAVSGGVIRSIQVLRNLTIHAGAKTEATAGSNRKDGANVNFETGEREGFSWNIPAIIPSLVSGDTVPNTGVTAALLGVMTAGSNSVAPCDQSGQDLSGVRSVKRSTRKYR